MIMSKSRGAGGAERTAKEKEKKLPELEDFLARRDYQGAITLLKFRLGADPDDMEAREFLAYAHFHHGDHARALQVYERLLEAEDPDPVYHTYAAACLFYMGRYAEAEEEALRGPKSPLQTRVLFHVAHRLGDEAKLMNHHQQLTESLEDQLSLAAIHYLRSHYQEATDLYKRLLLEHCDYLAINVYIALCYSKLDHYDVSLEILALYLQQYPDSALAVNLKACNTFRLYNGTAAEAELKSLEGTGNANDDNFLVKHNRVVFKGGEGSLQVLPPLMETPPEARLNLVIFHLQNGEVEEAYNLVKDLEPSTAPEYIIKAVVHISVGQAYQDSQEHLKLAQQHFKLVGSSASECDTIPGRQCMASCFFLKKQWEDVLLYLKSIRTYFYNDDDFNWNFGISLAAHEDFKEAEEVLLMVKNERYQMEFCYLSWIARAYIANGKAKLAWELYLRMDSNDDFSLLLLVANEFYRAGEFLFAAKAFDVLERLDPAPEYWEGKRGACVGVFRAVVAGREPHESLEEVAGMLRNTSNPQVEYIIRVMRKWQAGHGHAGGAGGRRGGAGSPGDEDGVFS